MKQDHSYMDDYQEIIGCRLPIFVMVTRVRRSILLKPQTALPKGLGCRTQRPPNFYDLLYVRTTV